MCAFLATRSWLDKRGMSCSMASMSKALSLLILALMAVHLVKPLGLPGLRKRRDFWKLAVLALAAISLTVVLSHAR